MATIAPETDVKPSSMSTMIWPPTNLIPSSLGIFPVASGHRTACINLSRPNGWFDKFILFMIIANSLVMAMTDYSRIEGMNTEITKEEFRWDPDTTCPDCGTNATIAALEWVFNGAFIFECIVKIIAFGFYSKVHSHSYIRDSWNKLDFFVVLIR